MNEEACLSDAAGRVVAVFSDEAAALAAQLGWTPALATSQLRSTLRTRLGNVRPDGSTIDGRAVAWRVRVQLQRADRRDIEHDTDEHARHEEPGARVIYGLPAVADAVAEYCALKHAGSELSGLDEATLRHSLKSIRPALSRKGGQALWRPRYTVTAPVKNALSTARGETSRVVEWLARVDLRRER